MKRNTPYLIALPLASILFGLVVSSALAQEVVVNGGFETGSFSSWTVNDPSAFTNIGSDPLFAHSGTYHANLGASGLLGSLSQDLATMPGGEYTLSFWLANDSGVPPNEFYVLWNGTPVVALTNAPSFDYTLFSVEVTATAASTPLEFQYRNDDDFFRLDDVSVQAVPEPATAWLVLAGLLGVPAWRKIRQKHLFAL